MWPAFMIREDANAVLEADALGGGGGIVRKKYGEGFLVNQIKKLVKAGLLLSIEKGGDGGDSVRGTLFMLPDGK